MRLTLELCFLFLVIILSFSGLLCSADTLPSLYISYPQHYTVNVSCPQQLEGNCTCWDHMEDIYNKVSGFAIPTLGLRVECSNLTGSSLHHDVDKIQKQFESRYIYSLSVRDSQLQHLIGLPSGLVELRHLSLDNTGIDLEQVRESSENLVNLKTFRVFREKFTEIPEDFFKDLHGLSTLALNDVGIRAISEDGFRHLEDSLKELTLKHNKMKTIPIAVSSLANLETLDLTDNPISHVPDGDTRYLESGLRSLWRLNINTVNCSCEFGKSEFVDWIRSHAIRGVICKNPGHLTDRDIATTPAEDFCRSFSLGTSCTASMILQLFFLASSVFCFIVRRNL